MERLSGAAGIEPDIEFKILRWKRIGTELETRFPIEIASTALFVNIRLVIRHYIEKKKLK